MGKPHLFPNPVYVLRKESLKEENYEALRQVHELSAKYSTPYFANCLPDYTGGHSNVMGCRTRLNTNWTGDWDIDTLRTGNLAYVSINLPRLAYKGDIIDGLGELVKIPLIHFPWPLLNQDGLHPHRVDLVEDFDRDYEGLSPQLRIFESSCLQPSS